MYIGTAAWSIPKIAVDSFPEEGSHLERYSKVLNGVEINSSFYNDHMAKSYAKWASVTPPDFRFSVKLNQRFTHKSDLDVSAIDLVTTLQSIAQLEDKWDVLLVQLPAGQDFHLEKMIKMYKLIRKVFSGKVFLEPRNLTWGGSEAVALMKDYDIKKVTADPEKAPFELEGQTEKYYRLHGTPEIYRSNYEEDFLETLYQDLQSDADDSWCIFDNTTFGFATLNALTLKNKGEDYDERYPRFHGDRSSPVHTTNEYR